MRSIITLAALCLAIVLAGCNSTQSTSASTSPGAMSACPADCSKPCCAQGTACPADCSKPCCAAGKPACGPNCTKPCCADKANMGAVKDCGSECTKPCGAGKANMGAVGDSPAACPSSCGSKGDSSANAICPAASSCSPPA